MLYSQRRNTQCRFSFFSKRYIYRSLPFPWVSCVWVLLPLLDALLFGLYKSFSTPLIYFHFIFFATFRLLNFHSVHCHCYFQLQFKIKIASRWLEGIRFIYVIIVIIFIRILIYIYISSMEICIIHINEGQNRI